MSNWFKKSQVHHARYDANIVVSITVSEHADEQAEYQRALNALDETLYNGVVSMDDGSFAQVKMSYTGMLEKDNRHNRL